MFSPLLGKGKESRFDIKMNSSVLGQFGGADPESEVRFYYRHSYREKNAIFLFDRRGYIVFFSNQETWCGGRAVRAFDS